MSARTVKNFDFTGVKGTHTPDTRSRHCRPAPAFSLQALHRSRCTPFPFLLSEFLTVPRSLNSNCSPARRSVRPEVPNLVRSFVALVLSTWIVGAGEGEHEMYGTVISGSEQLHAEPITPNSRRDGLMRLTSWVRRGAPRVGSALHRPHLRPKGRERAGDLDWHLAVDGLRVGRALRAERVEWPPHACEVGTRKRFKKVSGGDRCKTPSLQKQRAATTDTATEKLPGASLGAAHPIHHVMLPSAAAAAAPDEAMMKWPTTSIDQPLLRPCVRRA